MRHQQARLGELGAENLRKGRLRFGPGSVRKRFPICRQVGRKEILYGRAKCLLLCVPRKMHQGPTCKALPKIDIASDSNGLSGLNPPADYTVIRKYSYCWIVNSSVTGNDPPNITFVRGDATGIEIPVYAEALRTAGPAFLTEAFRHFGALSHTNRVTRITQFASFGGGNSGHKVLLSVDYERAEPGLHSNLFVKFSRDFVDVFRDRRRHELEAEVRFATLSRVPGFPIHVPAAYFADFHHESGSGMLITQRIAFGSEGIEPLWPKCWDHELPEPVAHYRAIVSTLARLAAAHKSGALSPQAERYLPFDLQQSVAEDPIPWNENQLRDLIARYGAFAAGYPQLLPAAIRSPQFIARLERDAVRYLRQHARIKQFLHSDRDYVALCHYNANIDNAWFWRDAVGQLQCGLLDWGRVRQMNVAYALWGSLCGTSVEIWNEHLDELLQYFIDEYSGHGGPRLDLERLKLHLDLYVASVGLSMLMDAPTLILARLPEAATASGPRDPVFRTNQVALGFFHVFTSFLNLWQMHDFGASLDRLPAQ